jgi:tetratricopeptide (TPR) repeat protein
LVLTNLGLVHWQRGQLERAAEYHREAVRLHRQSGSDYAIGLANLGRAVHDLGHSGPAVRYLTGALAQHRDSGDRGAEAFTCHTLATVYCDTGRFARAGELAGTAVRLARETDNRYDGATALNVLASVRRRLGDRATAVGLHGQALELARSAGIYYARAVALTGLADAFRPDRLDEASTKATEALDIALRHGYRVLEAHALAVLAAIAADRGDATAAAKHADSALALFRETGHRRGAAGVLALATEPDAEAPRAP